MDEVTAKEVLAEVSAEMIRSPIETERVLLRLFRETDFSDYYEYAAQKEQQRLSGNTRVETEEQAREVFDWILSPERSPLCFALEWKPTGKVIGNFSIGYYPFLAKDPTLAEKRGVSLSFILNESYWRQGIMTEMLTAAFPFFFEKAGLDYVNAGYFSFNEGSRRLQEKVGMRPYLEHEIEREGEKLCVREMILFREDYYR